MPQMHVWTSKPGLLEPGGACPPPDFGRFVNPISTRGADYAQLITTCPPPSRIFRPSYGPASYGITDTDSSTNFEGFELDTNWTYYVCTLVLYFSTFLARVDLWSLWSDLLRSWLSVVLRMTLLCTLLVLIFCVFAVLDSKLTFSIDHRAIWCALKKRDITEINWYRILKNPIRLNGGATTFLRIFK